jgi:hypothetical protein
MLNENEPDNNELDNESNYDSNDDESDDKSNDDESNKSNYMLNENESDDISSDDESNKSNYMLNENESDNDSDNLDSESDSKTNNGLKKQPNICKYKYINGFKKNTCCNKSCRGNRCFLHKKANIQKQKDYNKEKNNKIITVLNKNICKHIFIQGPKKDTYCDKPCRGNRCKDHKKNRIIKKKEYYEKMRIKKQQKEKLDQLLKKKDTITKKIAKQKKFLDEI